MGSATNVYYTHWRGPRPLPTTSRSQARQLPFPKTTGVLAFEEQQASSPPRPTGVLASKNNRRPRPSQPSPLTFEPDCIGSNASPSTQRVTLRHLTRSSDRWFCGGTNQQYIYIYICVCVAPNCVCIIIYCDCKSIVEHAQHGFGNGTWLCQEEMLGCSCSGKKTATRLHPKPFQVVWIPAYCFENIPVDGITDDMAASRHTTVRHIARNRLADLTAKEFAAAVSPVRPQVLREADQRSLHHQRWLSQLHELLPTSGPQHLVQVDDIGNDIDIETCQTKFPQWPWNWHAALYSWKPKIP